MTVIRRRSGTSTPGRLDTDLWRAGSLAERLEFAPWPALPPPSSPRLTAGEQLLPARTCGASSGGWRSDFLGLHRCLRAARRVGRYGGGHGRRRRGPDWHAGGDARGRGTAGLPDRAGAGCTWAARPTSPAAVKRDLPDRSVDGMRTQAFSMLGAAYAAGVRYVDAGPFLRPGGGVPGPRPAERGHANVIIGLQVGLPLHRRLAARRPQAEVKEHSPAMFTTQLAQSRALLGERIALYQVHSLTLDSGLWTDAPLLAALSRLRAEGVIIGLSTSGPRQAEAIRRALTLTVDGQQLFTATEVTWNLLEPSAGPAAAEAAEAGWAILIKEAVANGRLTAAGDPPQSMTALAAAHGVAEDAIALAAALAQPWASVVLSGAVTDVDRMRTWPRSASANSRSSAWPRPRPPTGRSGRPGPGTELLPAEPHATTRLPGYNQSPPIPSIMAATSAPTDRRRLRPALRPRPGSTSAAAASAGSPVRTSSQTSRDGSHRSSRISASRPCRASTAPAIRSAVSAASAAAAAYKKTPVFPALTVASSSSTLLRSRSRMTSGEIGCRVAGSPWTIRLTRHSPSTEQVYRCAWRSGRSRIARRGL